MIEREIFHSGILPPAWAYGLGLGLALLLLVLLRQELRRSRHRLRFLLYATRAGMALLLTIFLAEPNLLTTTRQEYPGKTLLVLDDSASMFVKDAWPDMHTQLALARALQFPELAGRDTHFNEKAARLEALRQALAKLREAAREAVDAISQGLPWKDSCQQQMRAAKVPLHSLKALLAELERESGTGVPLEALEALKLIGTQKDLRSLLGMTGLTLKQRDWEALAARLEDLHRKLDRLYQTLRQRQTRLDEEFLAGRSRPPGGTSEKRKSIAERLGRLSRYELAGKILEPIFAGATILNLIRGRESVSELRAVGRTDLVRPMHNLLAERPLELVNAVCLVSDGGQNRNYDLDLLDLYAKRGVKLLVVGVGGRQAGPPVSLEDCVYPRIISTKTPLPLGLDFKFNLESSKLPGTAVELAYSLAGETQKKSETGKAADVGAERPQLKGVKSLPFQETIVNSNPGTRRLRHRVRLKLNSPGLQVLRIILRLRETGKDESEFICEQRLPIYVFTRRPSILLVAERPDKFSEEILAQRRFGIRVYPVFTFGRPENAKRGKAKSSLPAAAADWRRYDLIILKGKPFPGFGAKDVTALTGQLSSRGLPLILVADSERSYLPLFAKALGWPEDFGSLPPGSKIFPADDAAHLPMLQLSSEIIANRNLWEQFQPPGTWYKTPDQTLPLIHHPETGDTVASLGFYGAGKLLCLGLGELERMNEWRSAAFNPLIAGVIADMLIPAGEWSAATDKPSLGVYPFLGVPGKKSVILLRAPKAVGADKITLTLREPDGGRRQLSLAGKDGWFKTSYTFGQEGEYTLTAAAASLTYHVRKLESAEVRDVSLNEAFLKALAQAGGGQYVPVLDLKKAVAELPRKTRERIASAVTRTRDFAVSILVLFLILSTADFAIRKQIGLVL